MTPTYEVQVARGKEAYETRSTSTRFVEAWRLYDALPTTNAHRKRLLRNGHILLRQIGESATIATPATWQEILTTEGS